MTHWLALGGGALCGSDAPTKRLISPAWVECPVCKELCSFIVSRDAGLEHRVELWLYFRGVWKLVGIAATPDLHCVLIEYRGRIAKKYPTCLAYFASFRRDHMIMAETRIAEIVRKQGHCDK